MAQNLKHFVFVLPNGQEYFKDLELNQKWFSEFGLRDAAREVVREAKMSTPRNSPKKITIRVFRLEIVRGQLKRIHVADKATDVPLAPMVQSEFDAEMAAELFEVPEEFRNFIRTTAWERGHSSGFESVLSAAQELLEGLKPCIVAYSQRKAAKPC